jgi:hypothetical protein
MARDEIGMMATHQGHPAAPHRGRVGIGVDAEHLVHLRLPELAQLTGQLLEQHALVARQLVLETLRRRALRWLRSRRR